MTLAFNLETGELKDKIQNKITYAFLDQHITKSKIDTHKLVLLKYIMEKTSLSKTKQEKYIIATMIVQIALDLHELIPNFTHQDEDHFEKLSKQLSVLGGDYYSSMYYVFLSELEDIEFTKILATAIKEVNEFKMNFYFQESKNIEEYIKLGKKIQSHIIISVAKFIGIENKKIISLIENILLLDLLTKEKKRIIHDQQLFLLKHKITEEKLSTYIDGFIKRVIHKINELYATEQEELLGTKHVFNQIIDYYMAFTEEGKYCERI